jgi:tetratricopeptide (TPR) repeat protein
MPITPAVPTLTPCRRSWLIGFCLVAATLVVYWSIGRADFLSVDDSEYVRLNQTVQAGLTWNGLRWAFGGVHVANYHPLTWLSHMLDCQIFGPDPGWHHRVNLVLHATNAVLLFLLLKRMTGREWASVFVAGVFALHPQHVESVAWIAERKDVLSGFFCILTLYAYARYVEQPGWKRYAPVLVLFALGLLSKSMLVTLPCVMLLIDCWPLKRPARWKTLFVEKVPLFAMSIGTCVVTMLAQAHDGAVATIQMMPWGFRLGNATVSYVLYARKFLYPNDLAAFYPLMRPWSASIVLTSLAILIAVTIACVFARKRAPYLLIGWLWFLGMLVPVVGIVQVGNQSMADRYMYLPMIGLAIMVAWSASDLYSALSSRLPFSRPARGALREPHETMSGATSTVDRSWLVFPAGIAAVALLIACGIVTATDVKYWNNSQALFTRALQRTEPNVFALHNLASAKFMNGDINGAIVDLRECVRLQPDNPHAHRALGYMLCDAKRYDEAHKQLAMSLELDDTDPRTWDSLGRLYAEQKNWTEAARCYQTDVRLRPDNLNAHLCLANAHHELGNRDAALADLQAAQQINPRLAQPWYMHGMLLLECDRPADAAKSLANAVALEPTNADAQYRLGLALMRSRHGSEAAGPLMNAVRLAPDSPEPLTQLAWLLATHPDPHQRRGSDALFLATRANELTRGASPDPLNALAAAQAEQRQFDDAVATAERASKLARSAGNAHLADQIDARLTRYRARQSVRDATLAGTDSSDAIP